MESDAYMPIMQVAQLAKNEVLLELLYFNTLLGNKYLGNKTHSDMETKIQINYNN